MTAVVNSPQESALSVIQGPTGSREWDRSSYVVPTGRLHHHMCLYLFVPSGPNATILNKCCTF